jgi:hypothetical protein
MTNEISPRTMSRLTGIFYLAAILGGVFAQGFVADRLINFRSATTTASNILAHEGLYRTGFSVFLLEMTAQIVMTVLFYYLLKPVSRSGALVATVLGLTGAVIKTVARMFFIVPLFVLHAGSAFSGYNPEQLSSLSLVLLRINDEGAAIALAFFGPSTFIQGWLMMKSTYVPKWIGILAIVGGAAWTSFYYPPLGRAMFFISAIIGLVGSFATIVWLIVYGVNPERFSERSEASASSSAWR